MVRCKKCDKHFTQEDWKTNKICENPNCNCPEVKRAMEQATTAIVKAQQSSKLNTIKVVTETLPTERDESVPQYFMDIPPITVITVTPPKRK